MNPPRVKDDPHTMDMWKDYGIYNQNEDQPKPFYITPLLCDSQYHRFINFPTEMLVEATDRICFYWEYADEHHRFIRRICRVLTEEEFNNMSIDDRKKYNVRNVHKRNGGFRANFPMGKMKIRKDKWTHVKFHVTHDPNKYFLEFVNIKTTDYSNPKEEVTQVMYAQNPNETPKIQW